MIEKARALDGPRDLPCLARVVAPWSRERGVRLAVLFGSRATGRARPGSDVDLAVWPAEPGRLPQPQLRLRWLRDLRRRLDQEVSLVVVSPDLDPVLGFEIIRHGRVLHQSEPNLWAWERLRLWQLYCDSAPLRRRERQALHAYAEGIRRGA